MLEKSITENDGSRGCPDARTVLGVQWKSRRDSLQGALCFRLSDVKTVSAVPRYGRDGFCGVPDMGNNLVVKVHYALVSRKH